MASTAAAAAAASATTAAAGAKIEQVSVDVEEKDFKVCAAKPRAISLRDVAIALDETGEQRERRIHNLFGMFDKSHSGRLDHVEIEEGFKSLSIPSHYKYAQDLLQACDCNQDGRIDYEEFKNYIDEKEMELYQIFQQIDVSNDGYIQPEELRAALSRAGINFNDKDLSRFVDRMDQDNNGIITFEEWRDFLLLYPRKATLTGIYQYWEKFSQVDIGEQAVIPEGISRHVNASKYLIAGGIAGAVSRTSTAPLDRLKVLLQVQTTTEREGVIKGLMRIYKESGVAGYFRGNGINVVKVAPESAIKFYSFELIKDFILASEWRGRKGDIGGLERLFAGGTAGAIAQTIVYPMDVVKTRLQTYPCLDGKAPHMSRLLRDIFIYEGPQAFFRGLIPSLIGIIPYAGIDLAAYETLKDLSRRFLLNDTEPGAWTQLACGTISGATGATCVYPLQVIRTRLQAQSPDSPVKYKGMTDVFVKTLKQEGISGFYKGLMPNLLKVAPAASITYIVYEDIKKRLSLS